VARWIHQDQIAERELVSARGEWVEARLRRRDVDAAAAGVGREGLVGERRPDVLEAGERPEAVPRPAVERRLAPEPGIHRIRIVEEPRIEGIEAEVHA
jgi:hypothetical protein